MISADGSKDNLIKPVRFPNYHLSPPSYFEPSSKLVVNNPLPDEQHCENDESDTVIFNENFQLIETEVAEDAKERNGFDIFNECGLSSN